MIPFWVDYSITSLIQFSTAVAAAITWLMAVLAGGR